MKIKLLAWTVLLALLSFEALADPYLSEQYLQQEKIRPRIMFYQCKESMGFGLEDVLVITPEGEQVSVSRRVQSVRIANSDLDEGDFPITHPKPHKIAWSSCDKAGCNVYELDTPYRSNGGTLYRQSHTTKHIIRYACKRDTY